MEWRAIVVASCVVFAAGCKEVAPSEPVDPPEPAGQPEPVGQPEPAEAEPEAEPPDEPEAPAGEEDEAPQVADLDVVDHEALVERIARGDQEVTVVAAWATWCVPCIEEMPTLAEFWKERRGDGIHVIGLSMDDPDEMGERIQSVLDRQRPPYEILVLEPGTEDAFMGAVDASWGGSLPATIVYDGDGEQVDFWMDKVTAEALDERVGERLAR